MCEGDSLPVELRVEGKASLARERDGQGYLGEGTGPEQLCEERCVCC